MTRLLESIRRFVKNNPNLTPEQVDEITEFFDRYVDAGRQINWQKEGVLLKYEDFVKFMLDYKNRKQNKKKEEPKGLDTLKEGVDYKIIYNNDGITGYEVLTYKASCTLASNQVEPEIWSDVAESYRNAPGFERNVIEDFPQKIIDGKILYGGAKWCLAYKSGISHWEEYTSPQQGHLTVLFFIGSNVPTGKVAVCYLPKKYWHFGDFYKVYNSGYSISDLGGIPSYKLYDNYFKTFPVEYILRGNIRTMWNAYDEEVTGNPEYDEIEKIASEIIGSSSVADSILYFMDIIGAERDGKMWSRRKKIQRDRTANFIKEHHMNRRYMVKEGKLRAKWNYWEGDFDCSGWGLETLENMPRHITGDFICKDNLEDFTEADIPEGVVIQGRKIFE